MEEKIIEKKDEIELMRKFEDRPKYIMLEKTKGKNLKGCVKKFRRR